MKKLSLILFYLLLTIFLPFAYAQEKLLSDLETYYDFLALDGYVERNYLNFRSLSDSKWKIKDQSLNLWKAQTDLQETIKSKTWYILAPEALVSYNSSSPYGQNDGLMWQGKGLNAYLSAGLRLEKYGFELTFKPEMAYGMNQNYDYVTPYYGSEGVAELPENIDLYQGKAMQYGYYGVDAPDAPQRFGDKPYWAFGWGDSEIRYSYKAFTVGFGTQYVWIGPARINSIMHSNTAPSYPKIDLGLRKTHLQIGKTNFGDIEGRLWVGELRESDYFDNDPSNDKRMFTALSVAYAPSFLKGFTLTANRSFLCPWEIASLNSVIQALYIPWNMTGARDVWDQRASVAFNYIHPSVGFEVYTELGLNDFSPSAYGYIRYPFHSMVYTSGMRKSVDLRMFSQDLRAEILLEVSNLEMSQDFQFQFPATFYSHAKITQGYTHLGQWLGAGNGTGGNSQYLGFKVYHTKGYVNTFVHRSNPNNDYIYAFSVGTPTFTEDEDRRHDHIKDFKAVMTLGANAVYFIRPNIQIKGGAYLVVEHNPLYNAISWHRTSTRYGAHLFTGISYYL